jgi:hypothetical protein
MLSIVWVSESWLFPPVEIKSTGCWMITNNNNNNNDKPYPFVACVKDTWVDDRPPSSSSSSTTTAACTNAYATNNISVNVAIYYPASGTSFAENNAQWSNDRLATRQWRSFMSSMTSSLWPATFSHITQVAISKKSPIRPPTISNTDPRLPASLPILLISQDLNGYDRINPMQPYCEEMAAHGWLVVAINHRNNSDTIITNPASNTPYFPVLKQRRRSDASSYFNHHHVNHCGIGEDGVDGNEWVIFNNRLQQRSAEISFVLDRLMAIQFGQPLSNTVGSYSINGDPLNHHSTANNDTSADPISHQFKGRLDLERIAIMGHSFGAAVAINSCAQDRRLKAVVGLDAWTFPLDSTVIIDQGLCVHYAGW